MLPARVRVNKTNDHAALTDDLISEPRRKLITDVCHFIKNSSKFNNIIHISGDSGSGKTTVLRQLINEVQQQGICRSEDILFLSCQPTSSPTSLLRCLAREFPRQDVDITSSTSVLTKNDFKWKRSVVKAAVQNMILHFRVICIDDVGFEYTQEIWKYIAEQVETLHNEQFTTKHYISLISTGNTPRICSMDTEAHDFQCYLKQLPDLEIGSVHTGEKIPNPRSGGVHVRNRVALKMGANPKARQLLSFLASDMTDDQFGKLSDTLEAYPNASDSKNPFGAMLSFAFQHLMSPKEKYLLTQLCLLREYLPLSPWLKGEVNHLQEIGVVSTITNDDGSSMIYLTPSVRTLIMELSKKRGNSIAEKFENLSVLNLWKSLLLVELQTLIEDARKQEWAFIPEKWQYTEYVGKKERYNVRDIILNNNGHCSKFKEIDILEESLYHALLEGDYKEATAIMFLMDRFVYWQGASKEFMDLVKFVQKKRPTASLAPQIIIRKARVLKNDGDLQGAEKILNKLYAGDTDLCNWEYKTKADIQVQRAVCVQIRGDIRRGLGFWLDSCRLLLQTVQLFKEVEPRPDKKGWASSLTLAAYALRYISLEDYNTLAAEFALTSSHPLLAAIKCIQEAADLCIYSPQFYAKNKRTAGEMNYYYSKLCNDSQERRKYLLQAAHELREGLSCHASITLLESREQYYEFVCSVQRFATVCLEDVQDDVWKAKGQKLLQVALHLYQHYCTSPKVVKHTDWSVMLIETALHMLRLPEIPYKDQLNVNELGLPDVQVKAPENAMAMPGESSDEDVLHSSMRYADTVFGTIEKEIDLQGSTADSSQHGNDPTCNLALAETVEEDDISMEREFRDATTLNTLETDESGEVMHVSSKSEMSSLQDEVPSDKFANLSLEQLDNLQRFHEGREEDTVDSEIGDAELKLRMEDTIATVESRKEDVILDEVVHKLEKVRTNVHRAMTAVYDPERKQWACSDTVAFVGSKYAAGNCRNAYHFEHLTQEEILGKYLGKQYIKLKGNVTCLEQYTQDIRCQMIAREYAKCFNKELFRKGKLDYGQIHFLPTVLVKLMDGEEGPDLYYNVEPFVSATFRKVTNNDRYLDEDAPATSLMLAYSHYTYQLTNGEHLVVDIQGWMTDEKKGQMYLTDPQIFSKDKRGFGTGNRGKKGMKIFFDEVHTACNEICHALELSRPDLNIFV